MEGLALWATDEQIIWNLKIVFMGMMVCLSCGVVGCFVVLRRMALLGDAVSHGILPGIVLAYLLSGSLSLGPLWLGACLAGLVCGACIEWLRGHTPLREDAAMGLTFTSLALLPPYPTINCNNRVLRALPSARRTTDWVRC